MSTEAQVVADRKKDEWEAAEVKAYRLISVLSPRCCCCFAISSMLSPRCFSTGQEIHAVEKAAMCTRAAERDDIDSDALQKSPDNPNATDTKFSSTVS